MLNVGGRYRLGLEGGIAGRRRQRPVQFGGTLTELGSDAERESALYALRKIGPGAQGAVRPLMQRMKADDSFAAIASAWALTRIARYHSENMARDGILNHVDRDGLDLRGRAEVLGLHGWRALGENIAYNQGYSDPTAFAVERWMVSDKHRENILNGEFTHAGIGIARSADGRVFFTQVFMER